MVIKDLRDALTSNWNLALNYIVSNNGPAVADRLRALGFSVGTDDDIFECVQILIDDKRLGDLKWALSVPMRTERIDPAEASVVLEVGSGMRRAYQGRTKANVDEDNSPPPEGASANGTNTADTAPADGETFSTVFGAIATGVTGILGTLLGAGQNPSTTNQTDTTRDLAANAAADEAARKAKTKRIIIISVSVAAAAVLIYIGYRAWKANKGA